MEKSVELILAKLDELIVSAGGQISGFYPYVMKQQFIIGLTLLLTFLVLGVFTIISTVVIRKKWQLIYAKDLEPVIMVPIISGISSGFLLVAFLVQGLGRFINPHYFAVRTIVEMAQNILSK